MSEKKLFEIVEEIPKARKVGLRKSKYDELYEAITNAPEGTKALLNVKDTEIPNVRSALIARRNRSEKSGDFRPFLLYTRDAKRKIETSKSGRKYYKLVSGKLYFKRMSKEEYDRKKRKKK